MRKVFGYECKRLLWNPFFFGLALVLWFYGWQVLNRITILGVSHTAPFSPWSFGDYLSRMVPLLWIGTLFFLTFFTSPKAKRAAVLTAATPAAPRRYELARCAAALAGSSLLVLVCIVEAAVFYGRYFGWFGWRALLPAAVVTIAPPLLFAIGSGWLLGKIRSWLLYGWMLLPLVCMVLPLPEALSIWNGSFFTAYPLTLQGVDPVFTMPAAVILAQCTLSAAGILLLFLCPRKGRRGAGAAQTASVRKRG